MSIHKLYDKQYVNVGHVRVRVSLQLCVMILQFGEGGRDDCDNHVADRTVPQHCCISHVRLNLLCIVMCSLILTHDSCAFLPENRRELRINRG